MRQGIFVSYRRSDSLSATGRLCDHLRQQGFGEEDDIFLDIDNIPPGTDFRMAIRDTLSSCDIVLLVIGRSWLTATDTHGRRRLDSASDTHRYEIVSALRSDATVIPVLVEGAEHPSVEDLPEELSELAYRNSWEISDRRFVSDVAGLADHLHKIRSRRPAAPPVETRESDEERTQAPPATTDRRTPGPTQRRRVWPPADAGLHAAAAAPRQLRSRPRSTDDHAAESEGTSNSEPIEIVKTHQPAVAENERPAQPTTLPAPDIDEGQASLDDITAKLKEQLATLGPDNLQTLAMRRLRCRRLHEVGYLSWASYESSELLDDLERTLGGDHPDVAAFRVEVQEVVAEKSQRSSPA